MALFGIGRQNKQNQDKANDNNAMDEMSVKMQRQKPVKQKSAYELIMDFYDSYANYNTEEMQIALTKLQNLIFAREMDGTPFISYFNKLYNSTAAFDAFAEISDYPLESVMRELLQNAFDCRYATKDIKLFIDFLPDYKIGISYNEIGFTMAEILYYLGFGINHRSDKLAEGRFGIGAKSVFKNVEGLSLKSNNFDFEIEKKMNGTLNIVKLNLFGNLSEGTKIVLTVSPYQYDSIKDSFMKLTYQVGPYVNLIELCFAFCRKKVLDPTTSLVEAPDRTFTIAVLNNGTATDIYRIFRYKNTPTVPPVVRFTHNNKSLIDFLHHEKDGFHYLIPYAIANNQREKLLNILTHRYNYFSTYELTGAYTLDKPQKFNTLSHFFISVPNDFITYHRTGIRTECLRNVTIKIIEHIKEQLIEYQPFLQLKLSQKDENASCDLVPSFYTLDFFFNFIKKAELIGNLSDEFYQQITIMLPNEHIFNYENLTKKAFAVVLGEEPETGEVTQIVERTNGIDNLDKVNVMLDGNDEPVEAENEEQNDDNLANCRTAFDNLVVPIMEKMQVDSATIAEKVLYIGCNCKDGSRVYCYAFCCGSSVYKFYSEEKEAKNDYLIYENFIDITSEYIDDKDSQDL